MNLGRSLRNLFHLPGRRSQNPSEGPAAPHPQARTATPPPSYHSHGGASPLFVATPPLPDSPAPSFSVNPRPGEQRLDISDFGDRLGRPASEAGSVSSLGLDGGSMHVHRPASEAGSRPTNGSAPSFTSSLDAQASHQGHADPEVTQNPTPGFAAFLERTRERGRGSRFREEFRD